MKTLLRWPAVQAALALLVVAYGRLLTATLRWQVIDLGAAAEALAGERGAIALFWHGRIGAAIACRPLLQGRRARVIISLSRDGGFIARAAKGLGVPVIRGSTGRPGEAMAKGGAAAFRGAVQAIAAGEVLLLTPDGPRGPVHTMPPGPVQLARAARAPAFVMGLAVSPAIQLGSWDRARIPLPFARAAVVVAGPFIAPVRAEADQIAALQQTWQSALREAEAKAEALLAARRR